MHFQASTVFAKFVRNLIVKDSTFENHQKSAELYDYIKGRENLTDFMNAFPEKYFNYSHSSMIRIEQGDGDGINSLQHKATFDNNLFRSNMNY